MRDDPDEHDQWTYDADAIADAGRDPDDPREYAAMQRVREELQSRGRARGVHDW